MTLNRIIKTICLERDDRTTDDAPDATGGSPETGERISDTIKAICRMVSDLASALGRMSGKQIMAVLLCLIIMEGAVRSFSLYLDHWKDVNTTKVLSAERIRLSEEKEKTKRLAIRAMLARQPKAEPVCRDTRHGRRRGDGIGALVSEQVEEAKIEEL